MTYPRVDGGRRVLAAILTASLVVAATISGQAAARTPRQPQHLFTRTTEDGVRIAAFTGNVPVNLICATDDHCSRRAPGIQMKLDVDGKRRVFGLPHDEARPVRGLRMVDAGGWFDRPAVQWSVVQVAPSIVSIRVHTGPDSVDEMRPVRGYAVFAKRGHDVLGRVEALDTNRTTVLTCSGPVPGVTCRE